MPIVCPTVTAYSADEYHEQMNKIAKFAERIHIDLTDGKFTSDRTVLPEEAWWPVGIKADFHLMYKNPMQAVDTILEHQPNLVIVHAEADGNFLNIAEKCHSSGVKIGLALLPKTNPESIVSALQDSDHLLIFSGNLGYQGGSRANLDLLSKIDFAKQQNPRIEIGWDGGINDQNISRLAFAGVEVFNVGGFLQSAPDPERAYKTLSRIAEETGTT